MLDQHDRRRRCERCATSAGDAGGVVLELSGTRLELLLCAQDAAELQEAVVGWLADAAPPHRPLRRAQDQMTHGERVRRWAREQGYPVANHGAPGPQIMRLYDAAHQDGGAGGPGSPTEDTEEQVS
jgi:hypothetical protein